MPQQLCLFQLLSWTQNRCGISKCQWPNDPLPLTWDFPVSSSLSAPSTTWIQFSWIICDASSIPPVQQGSLSPRKFWEQPLLVSRHFLKCSLYYGVRTSPERSHKHQHLRAHWKSLTSVAAPLSGHTETLQTLTGMASTALAACGRCSLVQARRPRFLPWD